MALNFPFKVTFTGKDKLSGPMKKLETRLDKFGSKAKRAGRAATFGITLPAIGLGASVFSSGLQFETSMNRVAALSGSTRSDLSELRKEAKRLGEETPFSANQAAEAFVFMGQAGFKAQQQLAAAGPVLDLATAGMEDLSLASDILTDSVKQWGKTAGDSKLLTDLMVGGITNATTGLEQFAEGMKLVAPAAAGMDQPIEDVFTLMTALSDAGQKGSLGGNILKRMFVQLLQPTKSASAAFEKLGIDANLDLRQANGQLISMLDIVDLLGRKGAGIDELLAIFGPRTFVGAQALVALGGDELRNLRTRVAEVGVAHRKALRQMQGIPGEVARSQAAFEGLGLTLFEIGLGTTFEQIATGLKNVFNQAAAANPETLRTATLWVAAAAAAGPLLLAIGGLATGLAGLVSLTATLAIPTLKALAVVFSLIGLKATLIVGGIALLAVLFGTLLRKVPVLGTVFGWVWDKIATGFQWMFDLVVGGLKKLAGLVPEFIKDKLGLEGSLFGPTAAAGETLGVPGGAPLGVQAEQDLLRELSVQRQEATLRLLIEGDAAGAVRLLDSEGDLPVDVDLGGALAPTG